MAYTETMSFRPRNGLSALCYWRIRLWCYDNGFAASDVFNSVIIPLSYYLENFTKVEPEKSMATIELNVGKLPILHVFGGKCYPLARYKDDRVKRAYSREELMDRINYWEKRHAEEPESYDALLKND